MPRLYNICLCSHRNSLLDELFIAWHVSLQNFFDGPDQSAEALTVEIGYSDFGLGLVDSYVSYDIGGSRLVLDQGKFSEVVLRFILVNCLCWLSCVHSEYAYLLQTWWRCSSRFEWSKRCSRLLLAWWWIHPFCTWPLSARQQFACAHKGPCLYNDAHSTLKEFDFAEEFLILLPLFGCSVFDDVVERLSVEREEHSIRLCDDSGSPRDVIQQRQFSEWFTRPINFLYKT